MPQANDLSPDSYTSLLFKGPFGFGKTIAAASFALQGPIYIAYFDKKKPIELLTFFSRFGKKGQTILSNITYDVYGSSNPHEYINHLAKLAKTGCKYTCHITDSVTSLTAAAVNWSLAFRDPKGPKKDKMNAEAPQFIPDFDEYKVETSLVTQALDLCKMLPCHVIWTAHPLPGIKVEGSGNSIKVTKTNPIVSYGSKVAGIIPGAFTEIYHFSQQATWDSASGGSSKKFVVNLEAVGDEFAKSPLLGDYVKELDITDRFFYEVWKEHIDAKAEADKVLNEANQPIEPEQPINLPKW